ncbi:MAG: filamentous hemagglutinin N-terminal domain-containing protein [Chlamydiales bacterium]
MNRTILFGGALSLFAHTLCFANPQEPAVLSGDVKFEQTDAATLSVTASDKAIINWKEFSIGANEITQFIQPNSQAMVLNRVTGELSSQLLGTLTSTGRVFLINPRGILIGKDAQVDTAHFVASSLDLSDHDFMEKCDLLFKGDAGGTILNLGTINAWDGDVVLLASCVENRGSITAPQGMVALAAASEILLKPVGQERIYIQPQLGRSNALVSTSGDISALQVELKSEGNPYSFAIKQSGKVEAISLEEKQGRIFLVSTKGGVHSAGSIASDGREIKIYGNQVTLGNEDASKSSLVLQTETPATASIRAQEEITVHDGFSLFLQEGALTMETAVGDINIHGHVKIQGSELTQMHAARDLRVGTGQQTLHSRIESKGPINIMVDRDLYLTASDAHIAQISTQNPTANISISVGRDTSLLGGAESGGRAYIFSKNNLSLVTGRHLTLDSIGEGYAALGASEDVTVVVDNLFSTPPLVGPGRLTMGQNTRMQGKTLRLFTVSQTSNTIEGVLNLVPFAPEPGAEASMSAGEVWGTYFFSSSGGVPFTIFYKDVRVSPRVTDLFIIATTEFFQDIKDFDEFFYVQRRFLLGYDTKAYEKLGLGAPNNLNFRMLRKTYKNSCGQIRELL